MSTEAAHITGYPLYGKVLIGLLVLTTLTILVPWLDLTAFTVLIALLLASTKAAIVLAYFMHLKLENLLLRILVVMVLAIYVSVILLTFSDYIFR
ncbi:MAG: cytochrome C oxidase subunit IV family protein [Bacteroidetes bacterium]|nr:cytochrome C oxidase subunit IV family protein [Bacteroidota bacterium]